MSPKVLKLPSALERGPHKKGPMKCAACGHEWDGFYEVEEEAGFECPVCGLAKGVFRGLIFPEGAQWTCNCGNAFYAIDTNEWILCINCGVSHGKRFFPEEE